MTAAALLAALGLAAAHVFAGRMQFLAVIPRSRWLSLAGGISVAYVFVVLLPELGEGQRSVGEGALLPFLNHDVYLLALVGLALFYGVERVSRSSRAAQRAAGRPDRTSGPVFWMSTGSFGLYNAIIGYLLHREDSDLTSLVLFALAVGVHFVVNDYGLREHHREEYQRSGRWVLGAALLAGWLVGALAEVSEAAIVVLLAFIAGGVILNTIKEELPEVRQSRFAPFAAGAAGYAALLQAIH